MSYNFSFPFYRNVTLVSRAPLVSLLPECCVSILCTFRFPCCAIIMLVSLALLVFLVTRLLRWYLAHLKCYPNVTLVSRAFLVFLVTRLLRWYLAHLKCYPNVTLVSRALLVFLVTQLLRWYLASIWCAMQSKIALRNNGVYFNNKKIISA